RDVPASSGEGGPLADPFLRGTRLQSPARRAGADQDEADPIEILRQQARRRQEDRLTLPGLLEAPDRADQQVLCHGPQLAPHRLTADRVVRPLRHLDRAPHGPYQARSEAVSPYDVPPLRFRAG